MGPDEMGPGGHGAVEKRGCFLLCGVVSCLTFFFVTNSTSSCLLLLICVGDCFSLVVY